MVVRITRGIFFLACLTMGILWAHYFLETYGSPTSSSGWWMLLGGGVGGLSSVMVMLALHFLSQELYERIAPALVAVILALVAGYLVGLYILQYAPEAEDTLKVFLQVSLVLVFGFVGIFLGLTRASGWDTLLTAVKNRPADSGSLKLVDTSVIIDGRITDVCDTGFVEGTLLVPRFVLHELQHIADSSDVLRRAKGRHGLDVLNTLQEGRAMVDLQIIEDDPKDVTEVDAKLIALARQYNAKILTTDFNLNKVAKIEGIRVLNINDLANALKPVVLPDERMEVKIIKEGKAPDQGVGYLDDGTMVVVDGGRGYLHRNVEALVTSVLQTAAGRMIFTRFDNVIS